LKLLIYEHVSAGGLSEKPIPPSILSEGFGMLRTFIEDAKAAGHNVTTILDSRIAELNPPLEADRKIPIHSFRETENAFKKAAENSDATYVIAPETNGTLQTLVKKIEQSGTLSLNSTASAIAEVSDKTLLQQHAKRMRLSTPETMSFNVKDNTENIIQIVKEKIGFPAVFKPTDSVGCEGLSIVNSEKQVKAAITKIAKQASSRFMAQQLIHGTPASVTIISNGTEAQPITLNKQNINLKTPSHNSTYNGGTIPLDDTMQSAAFATAKKLVESLKGLKGYIGVDLILADQEPVVIEVNPRLTTSYIGIRKVVTVNLAQAITDSTLEHKLPTNQKNQCYAHFEKVRMPNPTDKALQETFSIPELVSPPFPTTDASYTYALICTQGSTAQQAKRDFNKTKKQLRDILLSGGKKER